MNTLSWLSAEAPFTLLLMAISSLLIIRPLKNWRRSLINTGIFFVMCLCGDILAGMLDYWHLLPHGAHWLRELAVFGEGLAVIRYAGLSVFKVVLPKFHVEVSGILADILVIIIYIGWAFIRLNIAGVELTHLFATSAIITAVLAISMQDTLGNLLGGLALQMDNSLEIGEWIIIDDLSGMVTDIQWRYTALRTRCGERVVVPNSHMMKGRYFILCDKNSPRPYWRRSIHFNVDLSSPPARVISTVTDALITAQIQNVTTTIQPVCILNDFGQGFGCYTLRYWLIDPETDELTDSHVRQHILTALQRESIRLAVSDQTIHLVQEGKAHREEVRNRELKRRLNAIKQVELFNCLSDSECHELAERLIPSPFAPGDIMTKQGAIAHWLYIIISGEAAAWWQPPDGPRRLHEKRGPGSVFGELGLMTGAPRRATVIALSNIEAYRLDKAGFEHIIRARPELAVTFSSILQRRLSHFDMLEKGYAESCTQQSCSIENAAIGQKILEFFGIKGSS
jgi:small-conductance mechanosensitive channel